ncbi:inovirus Gp2 family protein [Pseudomonas sp. IC_126]|nr:inovirus Gp2 family protein [Pseudomonas sp. IC_126]TCD18151.1 inovirus Gp2 family protein [Pseudomonas sp. IC_126]
MKNIRLRKRHPDNPSLHLYTDTEFYGLPIQSDQVPFIYEHLERLHDVTIAAMARYPRVFAFRFDLHLPKGISMPAEAYTNEVVSRFNAAIKLMVRSARQSARAVNRYAPETDLYWMWTREEGDDSQHYHFVMLVNKDAFHTLGRFNSKRDNLYTRIARAWSGALRIPYGEYKGLVHVPTGAVYYLSREEDSELKEFFYRASYMCKARSKVFGHGFQVMNSSRFGRSL